MGKVIPDYRQSVAKLSVLIEILCQQSQISRIDATVL